MSQLSAPDPTERVKPSVSRLRRLLTPRLAIPADAPLPLWMIFPVIFAALYLTHWSLLRLPYYWDEAGYYIPAAWDFFPHRLAHSDYHGYQRSSAIAFRFILRCGGASAAIIRR